MAISGVHLESDAYMVCMAHALSTEREEVMGLCIGEVDMNKMVQIVSVIMLTRSDKQPDRVEISPEQLSAATVEAERLAELFERPLRVVGWYHSHPHITVWPSHVDVLTQAMYQRYMDEGFIGLIFSCFNNDKQTNHGRIQVTCFQAINQSPEGEPPMYERLEVPLYINAKDSMSGPCLDALVELPRILTQEELHAYDKTLVSENKDLLTQIHNGAVYTKSLSHLMEVLSAPLLQSLESRLERNKMKMEALKKEKEELLKELQTS
ncbi:lys-63-specific deubiquitinase BRCC36-like [Saccoglossus kowalevskii]|uniref:Lys-63-specific deubiquitinase BRCC36-like n=1 Tax=Saccoglossus kowalevskii TaxID=10224 RepID=A0ABM0GYD3_SACKO|nr:PREDICTED: lys-63-specific deubiquitinase BRCC36-like [Saccoglossus kowalevskii]